MLWRDPGNIASRDLLAGPGGDEMKPDLSSITYLKDESGSGYSVKYRVKDGAGKTWVAKVGNEARPETASTRLVWALGYTTEVNYLVPCVKIPGAAKPRKKVEMCEGGACNAASRRARGVKRPTSVVADNPFTGPRRERLIVSRPVNNWDLKDDNNKITPEGEGADRCTTHQRPRRDLRKDRKLQLAQPKRAEKFARTSRRGGEGGL